MRTFATVFAVAVLASAAAFAYSRLSDRGEQPTVHHKRRALTLSGHVEGLTPGVSKTLQVTVGNNLRNAVRLRSLTARVGDASATCPRSLLSAPKVRTRTAVPAHATRTVPMRVTLSAAAPDVCQSASFPLKYSARARGR